MLNALPRFLIPLLLWVMLAAGCSGGPDPSGGTAGAKAPPPAAVAEVPAPPAPPAGRRILSPGQGDSALAFSLPLQAGWNLVSFPVGRLTALQPPSGVHETLFAYDPAASTYTAVDLTPAAINSGAGTARAFWIHADQAARLGYDGSGEVPPAALAPGWNLVGPPVSSRVDDVQAGPTGGGEEPLSQVVCASVPAPEGCLFYQDAFSFETSTGSYARLDLGDPASRFAAGRGCWVYGHRAATLAFSSGAYSLQVVAVGDGHEYRFYHRDHHFLTMLLDASGAVALRPHPGVDVNGWGSTWYPQPFLPGAVLSQTTVDQVEATVEGIQVALSGRVCRGVSQSYGTWSSRMTFTHAPDLKSLSGSGTYAITLDGPVSPSAGGDLNLFKVASNYLRDVPLLGGGRGDTGDMTRAEVVGGAATSCDFQFLWTPPEQPGFYPAETTDRLAVNVTGCYNRVDTAAQGYAPIAAARKPSLKVVLASRNPGAGLTFGAGYDLAQSQVFYADNVGITPLVRAGTPGTAFVFDVEFESVALPDDGS